MRGQGRSAAMNSQKHRFLNQQSNLLNIISSRAQVKRPVGGDSQPATDQSALLHPPLAMRE